MFLRCNLRWAVLMVMVAGLSMVPAGPAMADEGKPAESVAATEEEPAEPKKVRERNWRVRFMVAFASNNNGIIATSVTHSGTSVSISGGVGGGVNFEYRYSSRMGFEMGAMAVAGGVYVGVGRDHPYYGAGVEVGGYVPITFALNFHPLKKSEVFDLYVGPLVATTIVSNVGVGSVVAIESRVDLGLGANLGFDINLGKGSRWSLNSGLKYISNVTESERDSRIAFDPLIWTFGFGVKF
jgi:outer membrane protein W